MSTLTDIIQDNRGNFFRGAKNAIDSHRLSLESNNFE